MKNNLWVLLIVVLLSGCRTVPVPLPGASRPATPIPAAPLSPSTAAVVASPVEDELQRTVLRQRQVISALMEQNDVLVARIKTMESAPPPTMELPDSAPPPPAPDEVAALRADLASLRAELKSAAPLPSPAVSPPSRPAAAPLPIAAATPQPVGLDASPLVTLVPNADGVVEISRALIGAGSDNANPFVVRYQPDERMRELSLAIGGVALGANPSALVNGRTLSIGEPWECFSLRTVESDALVFDSSDVAVRLPVGDRITKIRIPENL